MRGIAAWALGEIKDPRAIAPLTRDGLVDVRAGENRRHRMVSITPKGRGVLAKAYPRWEKTQARLLSALGDGLWDTTIAELQQLRRALEAMSGEATGPDGHTSSRKIAKQPNVTW